MSLKKYAEKRHFDKTPEPAGKIKRSPARGPAAPMFCIQRHHASHLHYDFRLEVGGTLKSWAVPKGPTLDPDVKHLAMMVEDHPIEYGDFEGVIPKGAYGAGSVMLWDRGTFELLGEAGAEAQLERGDFKFRLTGEKLNGEFAIVRMKRGRGNEWLLLKKRDAAAVPGWDPEDHAESVLTGRSQEEIAQELPPVKAGRSSKSPEADGMGRWISNRTKNGGKGSRAPKPGGRVAGAESASPRAASGKTTGAPRRAKPSSRPKISWPTSAKEGPLPKIVSPMLAEIGKGKPPSGDGWLWEIKWDGVRALCMIEDGKLRMFSRNGNAIEKQYPELSILPHHVKAGEAILDGEIAVLDEKGRPSFELLQRRMHVADASAIARLSRTHPVKLFVFDLLYLDGHDLRGVPLIERKKLLRQVIEQNDVIKFSEHFRGDGAELLEAVREQGLEGVISKRADSAYEPRRSSAWVKWKVSDSADFIVAGYTPGERDGLGALVLGEYRDGKLRWAGNVGTGFDRPMVAMLQEQFAPLETEKSPFGRETGLPKAVHWLRPELVAEVRFSNRTADGHLRAPVFLGLRTDVNPKSSSREPLIAEGLKELGVTIDGHPLKFTNLPKVYYPKDGYTKRDVLNYYDAVAPLLLPYLKDRPLSLKRYPNGVDQPYFFQKNTPESAPKWLRTVRIEKDKNRYIIGEDRATLLYLVNLGCIDHNPWMSRVDSLDTPDYILIDLDPQECSYEKIVQAAQWVRARLEKAGLESYPKTTGGDGMHLYIPVEPMYNYDQVRSFAEAIAMLAAHERPDLFTTPRSVAKREKGKVYFDWLQIGEGKTISAPYVLRAYAGAPVATPLSWSEVTPKLRPEQFHLGNALARFDKVGDLFEGVLKRPQRIEKAVDKLA